MFDTQAQILDHLERNYYFDDVLPGVSFIGCRRGMNGTSWAIDDERKIRRYLEGTQKVPA